MQNKTKKNLAGHFELSVHALATSCVIRVVFDDVPPGCSNTSATVGSQLHIQTRTVLSTAHTSTKATDVDKNCYPVLLNKRRLTDPPGAYGSAFT